MANKFLLITAVLLFLVPLASAATQINVKTFTNVDVEIRVLDADATFSMLDSYTENSGGTGEVTYTTDTNETEIDLQIFIKRSGTRILSERLEDLDTGGTINIDASGTEIVLGTGDSTDDSSDTGDDTAGASADTTDDDAADDTADDATDDAEADDAAGASTDATDDAEADDAAGASTDATDDAEADDAADDTEGNETDSSGANLFSGISSNVKKIIYYILAIIVMALALILIIIFIKRLKGSSPPKMSKGMAKKHEQEQSRLEELEKKIEQVEEIDDFRNEERILDAEKKLDEKRKALSELKRKREQHLGGKHH